MADMHLGALQRPTDPAELRYALTRTLPPRAVDLSQPRLLSRWQGRDVRVPIADQGQMGSCASWASVKAVMMAGMIAGRTVEMLAAGPLYEQARRKRGWYPQDSGSYIADNLDLLLPGGPAVIEPYRGDPTFDYNEAAWAGQETRDYEASHRPFYTSEGGFVENVWASLDAGMPVVFGTVWPDRWFTPNQGVVDADAPFSDRNGGHAFECWGIVPGLFLCANQWSTDWSPFGPMVGFDMRPGDFAIPWAAVDRGIIFEARAVGLEPVPAPPTPPEPPAPSGCLDRALAYLTQLIDGKWRHSYTKRAAAMEIYRDLPAVVKEGQ